MIRVNSIESSRIDNILNPPCIVQGHNIFTQINFRNDKSQQGKQFMWIRSNRLESTTILTHPAQSRGAIFPESHANRLLALRIAAGETTCVDSMEQGSRIDFRLVKSQIPKMNRLRLVLCIRQPSNPALSSAT